MAPLFIMYNLRNKRLTTYEDLLDKYSEEQIYYYYLGDYFCINKFISSPFKDREDSTPSFRLQYRNNVLMWFDFGDPYSKEYPKSVVGFVMRYFNISSYHAALNKIAEDMSNFSVNSKLDPSYQAMRQKSLNISTMYIEVKPNFNEVDYEFWINLKVPFDILDRFDTRFVNEAFIDSRLWRKGSKYDPMYAYIVTRDPTTYAFQLYRPFADKVSKFRNHNTDGHIFGLSQLPETGKTLVITKSCKDVLVLVSRGIDAICPFGEGTYAALYSILPHLLRRFEDVFIMYDPDQAGILFSNKIVEDFKGVIKNIIIPNNFGKDPADNVLGGQETEFFSFLFDKIK